MKELIPWLTEMSLQYGPFLFAILFIMFISVRTRKAYYGVMTRKEPPAPPEEMKTYQRIYVGTFSFGVALVVVSVVWWIFNQSYYHVFTGQIVGLDETEMVSSPEMYFKCFLHEVIGEEPQQRDEQFIIVQNEPISDDQAFTLRYSKGHGRTERLRLTCGDGSGCKYYIDWSDSLEQNILIKESSPHAGASIFGTTVYAAEAGEQPYFKKFAPEDMDKSVDRDLITTLQDERSDVGSKITALERLAKMDDEKLRNIIETTTPKEPMIQTLLDLSRHTDKELAYRARKVIEGKYDVDSALSKRILSADDRTFQETRQILFRTEPDKAVAILDSASVDQATPNRARLASLREEIQDGASSKTLVPTGSRAGDRYYVRAKWDSNDSTLVECLTHLFHEELIHDRTLEQEQAMMTGKSERIVWWYSKEWALWISDKIEECGAGAEFLAY